MTELGTTCTHQTNESCDMILVMNMMMNKIMSMMTVTMLISTIIIKTG